MKDQSASRWASPASHLISPPPPPPPPQPPAGNDANGRNTEPAGSPEVSVCARRPLYFYFFFFFIDKISRHRLGEGQVKDGQKARDVIGRPFCRPIRRLCSQRSRLAALGSSGCADGARMSNQLAVLFLFFPLLVF